MVSFFKKLLTRKSQGVGLEITPERLNVAQIAKQGQNYKLVKYCASDIPEGIFEAGKIVNSPALAELIQELLKENKINSKRVATGVPMRESIVRIIPVPSELEEEELRQSGLKS
jgi:type IV pilus assembly protein PilM